LQVFIGMSPLISFLCNGITMTDSFCNSGIFNGEGCWGIKFDDSVGTRLQDRFLCNPLKINIKGAPDNLFHWSFTVMKPTLLMVARS
jgi:hypothetical protein